MSPPSRVKLGVMILPPPVVNWLVGCKIVVGDRLARLLALPVKKLIDEQP
jgi:hypothetical protein